MSSRGCWGLRSGTATSSVWYRDFFDCVLAPGTSGGLCSVECGVGDNWDCRGNYEFRAAANETYEVEWHFVGLSGPDDPIRQATFPPLAGATVAACGNFVGFEECVVGNPNVLASPAIGAYGEATLTLRGSFDGFLRISGGAPSERAALYDWPCTGEQQRDAIFLARNVRNELRPGAIVDIGFPLDGPDRTSVLAVQGDCLGTPAPGLHFVLAGEVEHDAAYWGSSTFGAPSTQASGFGVLGVELRGVTDGRVVLEGRRADDGEVLSRREVQVGRDFSTFVRLLPLERGQR